MSVWLRLSGSPRRQRTFFASTSASSRNRSRNLPALYAYPITWELKFPFLQNGYGWNNKWSRYCKSKNWGSVERSGWRRPNHVLMTTEANFHLCGNVNSQNCRYWATKNLRDIQQKPLLSEKIVRCGVASFGVIGPNSFEHEAGRAVTVNSVR